MIPASVANIDAARAWDGPDGAFWADHEAQFDAAMAGYHRRLLDAANIAPGDRVLDVGCGNGQTAHDAARMARAGSVVGIDLSSRMLTVARRRAAQQRLGNVTFVHGDAQVYPFDTASFDVAVSRTGTMFFADPAAAFANLARALRPGGRLVQLTWQPLADNEWVSQFRDIGAAGRDLPTPSADAPGPFSLADPQRVARILTAAGFTDVTCRDLRERMYFGRDIEDAFQFVAGLVHAMIADLDAPARGRALTALQDSIAAHHDGTGVWYQSAAWLTTAHLAQPPRM